MTKAENIIIKDKYKGLKNLVLICDAMDEFAKIYHAEQCAINGVVFNEVVESDNMANKELLKYWQEYDKQGIDNEVELCECGGNKRVGLDCTRKPCKHLYYKNK